jgi:tRNA (guanine-N7-)-methyltransferase
MTGPKLLARLDADRGRSVPDATTPVKGLELSRFVRHNSAAMLRYLRPSDFYYPDDPVRLFGAKRPLHLEVGFGDGRFWVGHGASEGDVNYLGVEVSGVSLQKAFARYKAARVQNALVTRVSAEFLIRNALPEQSIARAYLNFPDPWPKGKHEENRFVRAETFELLSTRLEPGGELWLTTDHPGYYEFALEQAASTNLFDITTPAPPPAALTTKYAMRWQSQGLQIMHARFKVRQPSSQNYAPLEVLQGDTMPHSQLSGNLPAAPLEKIVARFDTCTVILLESFARADRVIVQVRVEEPDYAQEILVSIARYEDGRVIAQLETFGSPLITSGVKKAVGVVTDWLETTGMKVERRAY